MFTSETMEKSLITSKNEMWNKVDLPNPTLTNSTWPMSVATFLVIDIACIVGNGSPSIDLATGMQFVGIQKDTVNKQNLRNTIIEIVPTAPKTKRR